MGQLTPEFLFNLESRMRVIGANEYERLSDPANLWWTQVAREMDSGAKAERVSWLLDTAKIERPQAAHGGGQAIFEDLVMVTTEYEAENAVGGLELKKEQFDDLDGNGVNLAASWMRQITAKAVYWPQQQVADAIKANGTTYDGLSFFNASHPVNPFNTGAGTYSNLLAGKDVSSAVTVDVAINNIASALADIAAIKMPDGQTPRYLKMRGLLHPPALTARMQQITQAQYIAQAAATGGGSGDVAAVIRNFGLGTPFEAPELGANFGGNDTHYYIIAQEATSDELGAFVYVNREPFSVIFHDRMTDAELARIRKLQWLTEGRNVVGGGHPYLLFKCTP